MAFSTVFIKYYVEHVNVRTGQKFSPIYLIFPHFLPSVFYFYLYLLFVFFWKKKKKKKKKK